MSPHAGKAPESALADPTKAVATALTLGIVFLGLNAVSVWFAPILFVISVGGMVGVVIARSKAVQIERLGERAVDYQKLAATDTDKLLPWLKDNVRGHDEAVDVIFRSLKKNMQLARPGRTLGNFLLVGPTGTGKVFMSQLIGSGLYPESDVVQLNMNHYKQPNDVAMLIGSPPGTSGRSGRLTNAVLEAPHRVVILEEIDSAHREVQDCIAQILTTATCREKSADRLVDFSGCVFFATCSEATSNLRGLREEIGSPSAPAWLGRARDALSESNKFDRAFLSHWDGVFLMDRLSPQHVAEVACLQLARYWREYGIEVDQVSPELVYEIVERTQKFPEYGVQQIGRIVREITEPTLLETKRSGAKTVTLQTNSSGQLEVEVPR